MVGEILTIQVGGTGKLLGDAFWNSLGKNDSRFRQTSPIICDSDGSGNCYAKAFHSTGPPVANRVVNQVRRELEKCDSCQAVQFFHSLGGGTGSGLTGLLLKSVSELFGGSSSVVLYSVCSTPALNVLQNFNATLSLQDLAEYCHMVFPFRDRPEEMATNLLGMTADIRKLHSNLVPFKKAHFLRSCTVRSKSCSLSDLAHKAFYSSKDRYLATFLAYSGKDVTPSEVDSVTKSLQITLDQFFPDWIPNSVSASIHPFGEEPSLTCIANTTGIHRFLDRVVAAVDIQRSSFMHTFEEHGVHADEILEARNIVKSISNNYLEYANWDDKIGPGNLEQNQIALELSTLKDCFIP